MPSLQQTHNEAIARAVEEVQKSPLRSVLSFPDRPTPERLDVRVQCLDGSSVELRLVRVELDGAELIGYGANKEPILIALSNVQAVWHHRLRKLRSVGIIGGVMSGTGAIGAMLMAAMPGAVLGGAVLGVTLGVPLGFCAVILLDKSEVLYEWVLLYDRAAA